MILIAYDGSKDAKAAINRAATLMPGHPAVLLTVWATFEETMTRTATPFGTMAGVGNIKEIDDGTQKAALRQAEEGAALARQAGLDAAPQTRARSGSICDTILAGADDVHAQAVIVGSRGRSELKSLLLGSVSHALLQHADRSVLVVPSANMAEHRREKRRAHERVAV
jgi:nucleotide-binding universal stress UspA family protein